MMQHPILETRGRLPLQILEEAILPTRKVLEGLEDTGRNSGPDNELELLTASIPEKYFHVRHVVMLVELKMTRLLRNA